MHYVKTNNPFGNGRVIFFAKYKYIIRIKLENKNTFYNFIDIPVTFS
ncbi:hypothetical protein FCR2A7T_12300 [Flavobacterium cauense R2A-7]|nr:hypothetical protein FCR2A7T_12300 [Flavobacterium cauense R2A-7]